ncbi:MAG: c-type cytochrome [Rubrivivax sp.]|nr:c-type cytochrome [Rubrivivax sp.]
MRSVKTFCLSLSATLLLAACAAPGPAAVDKPAAPRLGKAVTEQSLAAWNIDVRTTDGLGLPPGSGTVAAGKLVYEAQCIACHGAEAKGGTMFGPMVGGIGSFKTNTRVLTVGSMYPYAPVLFDYVRRAMPLTAPQSLSNDETYAVSAYLLHLNGLVPANAVMNRDTLAAVRMPNRDNIMVDTRPDTQAVRCTSNCPPISAQR